MPFVGTAHSATSYGRSVRPGTNIFSYKGVDQFYTVPPGITSLNVYMWGAGGGGGYNGRGGAGAGRAAAAAAVLACRPEADARA